MLTGQAKTDYQRAYMREYMRNRRNVAKSTLQDGPGTTKSVRPAVKTHPVKTQNVKTQSYNPMMVGYVPEGKP